MLDNTKAKNVHINKKWCKSCAICQEFCPQNVFEKNESGKIIVERPERCTLCGMCQLRCPEFAIHLEDNDND